MLHDPFSPLRDSVQYPLLYAVLYFTQVRVQPLPAYLCDTMPRREKPMLRRSLRYEELVLVVNEVLRIGKQHYTSSGKEASPIAIEELPRYMPWRWDFRVSFREQPDIDVAISDERIEEIVKTGEQSGKQATKQ